MHKLWYRPSFTSLGYIFFHIIAVAHFDLMAPNSMCAAKVFLLTLLFYTNKLLLMQSHYSQFSRKSVLSSTSSGVLWDLAKASLHFVWTELVCGPATLSLVGTCASLRKETIRFFMRSCLSVRSEQLCPHWTILMAFDIGVLLEHLSRIFKSY